MKKWVGLWLAVAVFLSTGAVARADMQDVLRELETYATQVMADEKVPGMSCAIVKDDALVYAKGFGVRELGKAEKVNAHTAFEIGSTSKAFTVALLAMLVDQKAISWDDPVRRVLPGFSMYDPWVTKEFRIADLVSQRSGMTPYSLDLMSFLGFDRNRIIRAIHYVEPITSFRSTFGYVNNLFLVAGKLIENETGLRWEDALDAEILGPLGMSESTANPEVAARLGNIATGHMTDSQGSLSPIPKNWPYADWINTYGPAGGIRSNVIDMTQWIRLQLGEGRFEGRQLISKENLAYMHDPKVFVSENVFGAVGCYASGWIYNGLSPQTLIWHNGETSGMHSIVALIPKANVGLVVLTNSADNDLPEKMASKFYQLYFNTEPPQALKTPALLDGPGRFLPKTGGVAHLNQPRLDHLPFDRYCGTYSHPAYGRIVVREVDKGLFAFLGPRHIKAPLTPYSGNTFVLKLPEISGFDSLATFEVNPGEKAKQVTLQLFSDSNKGKCSRVSD